MVMSEIRRTAVGLVVALLLVLAVGAGANANERYALGELVVQMAEGESIDIVNGQFGTVDIQHLPQLNVYQLNVSTAQDLEVTAAQIEALPQVVFCHPNYLIDPLNTVQSSLPVSDELHTGDYLNQPAVEELRLAEAQALSRGANVKVAVLDGGVEYGHPAFGGKAVSGYDYVDDDYDASDEPGGPNSGHGTFVAGVIHLVAPDAVIRSYRVTNVLGESDGYIVAEAILQAVADGCQVINLSMVTMDEHKGITSALQYARDHGVLTVAAAGNGQEESARYPASDANAIGVAAVDSNLTLADFSNFGQYVDICAPGTEIYGPYQDGGYAWWDH